MYSRSSEYLLCSDFSANTYFMIYESNFTVRVLYKYSTPSVLILLPERSSEVILLCSDCSIAKYLATLGPILLPERSSDTVYSAQM